MKLRLGLAGLFVAAVAGCGTDVSPKQAASGTRSNAPAAGAVGELTKVTLKLPGMT